MLARASKCGNCLCTSHMKSVYWIILHTIQCDEWSMCCIYMPTDFHSQADVFVALEDTLSCSSKDVYFDTLKRTKILQLAAVDVSSFCLISWPSVIFVNIESAFWVFLFLSFIYSVSSHTSVCGVKDSVTIYETHKIEQEWDHEDAEQHNLDKNKTVAVIIFNHCPGLLHPFEEGVCTGLIAVNVPTLVLHWQKVLYYIVSFIRSVMSLCLLPFNLFCHALQRFS